MGLLVLGCRKIYGLSHSSWPGSLGGLGPPHPSRAAPRSTFPVGEGDLPAGDAWLRQILIYLAFSPRKRYTGPNYREKDAKIMNMDFKRKLTIPYDLKKEYPVTVEMAEVF